MPLLLYKHLNTIIIKFDIVILGGSGLLEEEGTSGPQRRCLAICGCVPKPKTTLLIFIPYNIDLFVLSINLESIANCFYFDFAVHTQYIAFVVLMHLACADCSLPVTSACLHRLNGIKLIYNTT